MLTDSGRIIGMISQSDLLHRAEVGTERKDKWWFRTFTDSEIMPKRMVSRHTISCPAMSSRSVMMPICGMSLFGQREPPHCSDFHCSSSLRRPVTGFSRSNDRRRFCYLVLVGASLASVPPVQAQTEKRVTILYDAFGLSSALKMDWVFAVRT